MLWEGLMNKDLEFTLTVLSDYGHNIDQIDKNICCLFHEETRPSARLFSDGHYYCWTASCNAHFSDGIGALMQLEECDYKKAIQIAENNYGYVVAKKKIQDLKEYYSIQDSIVSQVIKQKPEAFLSVYKTLDRLMIERDLCGLKKLHRKLLNQEII